MGEASVRPQIPDADSARDVGHNVAPLGSVAPISVASSPLIEPTRSIDALSFVMDVPVELTVELGRKKVRIGEVLRLGPGSVIELDKASGEPLDIYVNNRLIARGEAVVAGERYGIRLTEVMVNEETRPRSGRKEPGG